MIPVKIAFPDKSERFLFYAVPRVGETIVHEKHGRFVVDEVIWNFSGHVMHVTVTLSDKVKR